jgi:thymidine phosphorylase
MEIALMMAMKHSSGISHLVVDIPVGPQAFIKSIKDSVTIRKTIEFVAKELDMTVDVAVTDGREPIGCGIGALLEAKDVIRVLKRKDNACDVLTEKALFIASKVIEFDPKLKGGEGYIVAKEMLDSLRALNTFDNIVNIQGKLQSADLGELTRDIIASKSGEVKALSNRILTHIAVTAGAASYAGSGIQLFKKATDRVSKGDVLYRIYANNSADFTIAVTIAENSNGFEIGR